MTTETRTTIEPSDITAIEFECRKCHTRTIRLFNNWLQGPSECSNCGEQWMLPTSVDLENVKQLVALIRGFANGEKNGRPFKLRLELSKP